ncbi:unnamed protein product [Chironomus riparius]|uniref:Salivary secreted peptide n=1 Tax=Chironomus riparius TaxID=315576 RepID=A0A9N9RY32_9DIPT|nr:unnamed protein product [Chironomus riparius]
MAKLTLILIAVFLFVQLAMCATREKRETEATTANILDSIKTGIESTFSEQNIKKAVDNLSDFGDKLKDLGSKVVTNFQNAMKKDDTTA